MQFLIPTVFEPKRSNWTSRSATKVEDGGRDKLDREPGRRSYCRELVQKRTMKGFKWIQHDIHDSTQFFWSNASWIWHFRSISGPFQGLLWLMFTGTVFIGGGAIGDTIPQRSRSFALWRGAMGVCLTVTVCSSSTGHAKGAAVLLTPFMLWRAYASKEVMIFPFLPGQKRKRGLRTSSFNDFYPV